VLRLIARSLVHAVYRLDVRGLGHLPRGGALLVANHLSHVDALLVGVALHPRHVRFLMHRSLFSVPLVGAFAARMGAIPVASEDDAERKRESLRRAADAAAAGDLVCIFPEGAITRSGTLLPFARGLETIGRDARVPIVPVALDRLWGSVFSYSGGRFFWKRPRRLPYRVDLTLGAPLPFDSERWRVRDAVAELLARRREEGTASLQPLSTRLRRVLRAHPRRAALLDGTGRVLACRELRRELRRPSCPEPLRGRVEAIARALEEKGGGPAALVITSTRRREVLLSQAGLQVVADALAQVLGLGPGETILAPLPLSTALGTIAGLWAPLLSGARSLVCASADADEVARLARGGRPTILVGTPALYAGWLGRLDPADLAPVRVFFCGGDRLDAGLARAWSERFDADLVEGYGCAEMSGVVSVNLPHVASSDPRQKALRAGTVGRPLPGVAVRVVDPDSFEPLPPEQEGLLLVRGPGRMLGYRDDERATAAAFRDGWFVTGDRASVDRDGFLRILARASAASGAHGARGAARPA